jgi:hypothetical protein
VRCLGLLLLVAAIAAADGPPSQAEQDEIWRKAMEESRQVRTRTLPKRGAPAANKAPAAVPAAEPVMPAAESSSWGAGWWAFGAFLVVAAIVNLRPKRPAPVRIAADSPCMVFHGWWLTSPVRVAPVRTPLGGRVTVLLAQVDIAYEVDGETVHIRQVALAHGTDFNVASERTGEAFTAVTIGGDVLAAGVAADLGNPDCRLRSTLLKAWRERHHEKS